nr:MAG: heme biosynthesis protein HemY [Pseudomonadota bacterium]
MLRLVLFLLAVLVIAFGLSWLADRPGSLIVQWQGYEIETSVFRAIVILAVLLGLTIVLWSVLRQIWNSPAAIGQFLNRRREKRGLEALSSGMIAIGAGDKALATRYAIQARKSLPNEPLTHLLRAQAAQLSGDRVTARRIFEAMLASPDTEQLGLRGLFLEAEREGEEEAARQFAERAMRLNPKLSWPVEALFEIQCRRHDWAGALETLAIAKRHHHIDRALADRRRAVLLTAQAQELEDTSPETAMNLALEAHSLAPDLVPAAAIAGRVLAAKGHIRRAAKVLQRTWKRSPHPDIATAYAYVRIGDSPRDRLERVKQLAALRPHSIESALAVATAAIEARDWATARHALQPLLNNAPTQRACMLMARIEAEQHGDRGRVREWLARAVSAPRDPAWTADGVVSEKWAPTSPVTGALDAFQWRVPVEATSASGVSVLGQKLSEFSKLDGPEPEAIEEPPVIEAQAGASLTDKAIPATDAEVVDEAPSNDAHASRAHTGPASATSETTQPAAAATKDQGNEAAGSPGSKSQEPAKATDGPVEAKATAGPASKPAGQPAQETTPVAGPDRTTVPDATTAAEELSPATVPATAAREEAASQPTTQKPAPQPFRTQTRPIEPRIFVPPRPPDDPGPDPDGDEDVSGSSLGLRLPLKGSI